MNALVAVSLAAIALCHIVNTVMNVARLLSQIEARRTMLTMQAEQRTAIGKITTAPRGKSPDS